MSGPALTGPVQVVATLRPLSREALRLVIDGPARLADIDVDEHLVARPAGLLRLFTVDEQGRPTRWRVNRADLPTQVVTELDTFVFVARRLLTTDSDNGTTVIGVAATAPAVGAPAPSCQSCSSSPWLAPGSRSIDGGTVVLWNVADPTRPRRSGPPLTGQTERVLSVALVAIPGHLPTLTSGGDDGADAVAEFGDLGERADRGE